MGQASNPTTKLSIIPVVDDIIRAEQNLLRIGFFAATDTRSGRQAATRKVEMSVTRDNQRITAVIEFEGLLQWGLPSTADRDKYMILLKLAEEQRVGNGPITNPIRFTGYRMLKELGLALSGSNYDDINAWGNRMAGTRITSRQQVIYHARQRRYGNKISSAFESFQRVGFTGKGRSEEFEVVLAGWLLENLNDNYVFLEDFGPYKELKRSAIAKAVYGLLHWWFRSSDCRAVEKDYKDLCMLLGTKTFESLSRIKYSLGPALDKLVSINYLSRWDIQSRVSGKGYKVMLWAGESLIRSLTTHTLPRSTGGQKLLSVPDSKSPMQTPDIQAPDLEPVSAPPTNFLGVLSELIAQGVARVDAEKLVKECEIGVIQDTIEYVVARTAAETGSRIYNPAGLIIYHLRNNLPIPSTFVPSRVRRNLAAERILAEEQHVLAQSREAEFQVWRDEQVAKEVEKRYPAAALHKKIREIVTSSVKHDPYFSRLTPVQREDVAHQILRKEIRELLLLPSFEEWYRAHTQNTLFQQEASEEAGMVA